MQAASSEYEGDSADDETMQGTVRTSDRQVDEEEGEADVELRYARKSSDDRLELLTARSDENDDEGGDGNEADPNELSVDSLPSELATGRTGVDELLNSMFTARTEDTTRADDETHHEENAQDEECKAGGDNMQNELGLLADQDDDDEQDVKREQEQCEEFSLMGSVDEDDPFDQRDDEQQSERVNQPANMDDDQLQSSLLPEAKPHDDSPTSSSSSSTTRRSSTQANQLSQPQQARPSVHSTAARIIAFDVGGKLFRCKESLIRKYPLKRLNQVISCGCERIGHDTFFIDRNPQHFEVILDWYRTGCYVRHPHVSEQALQEDAKYFDLLGELFPDKVQQPASKLDRRNQAVPTTKPQPPIPPRPHRQKNAQPQAQTIESGHQDRQQHHSEPRSDNNNNQSSLDTMRFCKSEHRSIEADGVPVVFMVRKHEHLLVASIEGRGKLLVRVCDATGLQSVQVPSAVLFDSQSYFYLQGGRVKLQHCLLPGGHTYTFWMEIDSGAASAVKHELNVEFKLLSTFRSEEQLLDALDDELQSFTNGAPAVNALSDSQTNSSLPSSTERTSSFSPFMFLPPRYQQHHTTQSKNQQQQVQTNDPGSNQRGSELTALLHNGGDRDVIAKQLFSQSSASPKHNGAVSSPQSKLASGALPPSGRPDKKAQAAAGSTSSAQMKAQSSRIKRSGAAIVAGSANVNTSSLEQRVKPAGKITIYQHAQLQIAQTPREVEASSPRYNIKKHEVSVTAKYQDHQPRLFR